MILCDKCSQEIPKLKETKEKETVALIKKLKLSDFGKAKRGSIMDLYYAKLPNKNVICFYYGDNFGEARIMIEGTGRWIASVNFHDETPEQCLKALQKLI